MQEPTPTILLHLWLETESPFMAWYQIKLLRLQEGFIVKKYMSQRPPRLQRRLVWEQDQAEKK